MIGNICKGTLIVGMFCLVIIAGITLREEIEIETKIVEGTPIDLDFVSDVWYGNCAMVDFENDNFVWMRDDNVDRINLNEEGIYIFGQLDFKSSLFNSESPYYFIGFENDETNWYSNVLDKRAEDINDDTDTYYLGCIAFGLGFFTVVMAAFSYEKDKTSNKK